MPIRRGSLSDQKRNNRHRGDPPWPGRWTTNQPGGKQSSHGRGHRRPGSSSPGGGHHAGSRPPERADRAYGPASHGSPHRSSPPGGSSPLTDQIKKIDPFELFCAYHLGITKDKQYRPLNLHDVARRLNVDGSVIKQALQAYGMDADALLNTEFDLTMAQLDIQVAPEGVDRVELAKGIYEEFRRAPRRQRDWKRVLEEDARENAKIFGRR